ncbi:MAG: ABC transporter ATP-binding protein [Acidobacteriota bacterium]|nr:ABC transporter ATP-binding protein [Acidobacteriota bacterium]
MTAEIELKNITLAYGATPVLRDVSLSAADGEFVALLGASGCGKTTALKIIAGLLTADSGEVWLGGENISNVPAERRQTAMVFQKPLLFPFLNVAENVAFGLKMRSFPKAEIKEKVREALSFVQLENFENRSPKQLSGGQEQRVALARALIVKPRVLLLDEPFSALDARLRVEMRTLIRRLQQRLKITTIFVTHDQEEAVSIADRIAFLDAGALAQISEPKDFYTNPQTARAARFFGWKILSGSLKNDFIETAAGKIRLADFPAVVRKKDLFEIGFHPNRVEIFDGENAENDRLVLRAKLERIINLGAKIIVSISFPDGEIIEVESFDAAAFIRAETTKIGEPINISIRRRDCRFF